MNVSIRNYKSIRSLDFESRRVNVIIGEPNCGKTNVIEALGLLWPWLLESSKECLRAGGATELFFNHDLSGSIRVSLGKFFTELRSEDDGELVLESGSGDAQSWSFRVGGSRGLRLYQVETGQRAFVPADTIVRPFLFVPSLDYEGGSQRGLAPPHGANLPGLLLGDKASREIASGLFTGTGFSLQVNVADRSISVSKSIDGLVFSFPFTASSETLRRILFYRLAVETNQNSVLLFDEPEANTFPMFTKLFAEQIAADDHGNTFFLTTHSPYLLGSLIEKTPKEELAVVLCHMENFETKARVLSQNEVQDLLDLGADAFFNLDRLTEE